MKNFKEKTNFYLFQMNNKKCYIYLYHFFYIKNIKLVKNINKTKKIL